MKRRKRRVRRAEAKKRVRTALQVVVSSLSLSLLYYKMMQPRHHAQAAESEDSPTIGQPS